MGVVVAAARACDTMSPPAGCAACAIIHRGTAATAPAVAPSCKKLLRLSLSSIAGVLNSVGISVGNRANQQEQSANARQLQSAKHPLQARSEEHTPELQS